MSAFQNYRSDDVATAAEKFIAKMDEGELAAAIAQSARSMHIEGRAALIESIFDAFRARGESSEDAAEGAGASLDAIAGHDTSAVDALLRYAQQNPGLLREAATSLIEQHPSLLSQLAPVLVDGITRRLQEQ